MFNCSFSRSSPVSPGLTWSPPVSGLPRSIECLESFFKNDANDPKKGTHILQKLKQSPEALPLMNGGLKSKIRCISSLSLSQKKKVGTRSHFGIKAALIVVYQYKYSYQVFSLLPFRSTHLQLYYMTELCCTSK